MRKFSRGQMSALGIVLGLASRAPITFFDEPYLGLDATARAAFYDVFLRDFSAHPRTFLVSTHLIDEMDRLLERVVILDQGRVVQDADVDELRGHAFEVGGRVAAVAAFATDRKVLSQHTMGMFGSVVIEGTLSPADRAAASEANLEISPVSLQKLVAAYGFTGDPGSAAAEPVAGQNIDASTTLSPNSLKGERS